MKKASIIIVAVVLVFALTACGGEKKADAADLPENTPAETPELTPEPTVEVTETMVVAMTDTDVVSEPKMILPDAEYDVIGTLSKGAEAVFD